MHGETILCIATRMWDSLWRDSQQIMSRIARENTVLYFEPGRDQDSQYVREMRRTLRHFFGLEWRTVQDNLIVIPTPPRLPYMRQHLPRPVLKLSLPLMARANAWITARHVRRAVQAFHVDSPILWLYEPRDVHLVGNLGEKLACYYNYDEMPDFVQNCRIRTMLRQYDDSLSSQADIVFATSRGQYERRRKLNPRTYFVPNGVDFTLFNGALHESTSIPRELERVRRPIIGFAGWLGNHIDVELLTQVAEAHHEWSLVLVGPDRLPTSTAKTRLCSMSNVLFLGQKDLGALPAYLKAFDVALMPYLVGGHTLTAYPLKLHEYLASGRAIVATALPELLPFSDVVRVAETRGDFVKQIGEAARDYEYEKVAVRVALARQNTWDHRVEAVYEALAQHPKMQDKMRKRRSENVDGLHSMVTP